MALSSLLGGQWNDDGSRVINGQEEARFRAQARLKSHNLRLRYLGEFNDRLATVHAARTTIASQGGLPPHLVLRGIAGNVEELDFVDADEAGMVSELADDAFLLIELEELRGGGEVAVAEPVDDECVAIREALEAADEAQRVVWHFLRAELPHGFAFAVEFEHGLAFAAGNEEMTVGQFADFVRIARRFDRAEEFAFGAEFEDGAVAFGADEVAAILGTTAAAHLIMRVRRFHRHGDLAHDLAIATDFNESLRAALDDHHVTIGQGLTAVDLGLFRSAIAPDDFVVECDLASTSQMTEEHIAIREHPHVLRLLGRMLPLHAAIGSNDGDLVAAVVADEHAAAKSGCGFSRIVRTDSVKAEATFPVRHGIAQQVAIVPLKRRLGAFPTARSTEMHDVLAFDIVDAQVVHDEAVARAAPAMNGAAAAFDDVSDDLVTIEIEVRLDARDAGLHVVVIALHVAQMPAKRRMTE